MLRARRVKTRKASPRARGGWSGAAFDEYFLEGYVDTMMVPVVAAAIKGILTIGAEI